MCSRSSSYLLICEDWERGRPVSSYGSPRLGRLEERCGIRVAGREGLIVRTLVSGSAGWPRRGRPNGRTLPPINAGPVSAFADQPGGSGQPNSQAGQQDRPGKAGSPDPAKRTSPADEADAAAARTLLTSHVPDPDTGLCLVCFTPSPCRPANAAANRLNDLGQPLPLPEQVQPRPGGWREWLWRPFHWRAPRPAPLLSYAWRQRLVPNTTYRVGNDTSDRFGWREPETNQRPYRTLHPATNQPKRTATNQPKQSPGRHRRPEAWRQAYAA